MSEELDYKHAAAGVPNEPTASPITIAAPSAATAPSSSTKRKFVPGGGSALAKGDKPGDPFATLVVLPADNIVGAKLSASSKFPSRLDDALTTTLGLVENASRSVAIVAGGDVSTAMMSQMGARVPAA